MTIADRKNSEPSQSEKTAEKDADGGGWRRLAFVSAVLLAVGMVIFRNFVFGGDTLLYKDIGSDSVNISYPYYILLSDYLRNIGIPSWSFQVGMGHDLFPYIGTVLVSPVVWLSKPVIARALVYQHLIYVLISGLLFARFLSDRRIAFGGCVLGALSLAFSAYMCAGSCWYFHATEVMFFAFLLYAAEQAVGRGHWVYLVLAVTLIGFFSVFHLYLCALFLVFYVPPRVVIRYSWRPLPALGICLLLAAAALLGVALTTVVSLGSFQGLVNSPRGSGPASLLATLRASPVFGLESHLHYVTAILRPFANDMLGTGSDFRGWRNYLEAPLTYCGIISLILLPQAFIGVSRQTKILYAVMIAVLVFPVVFPWFRYLFWAFQGDYYRTLSLFFVFAVLTLAMTALDRYLRGQPLHLWLLGLTAVALVGILYLPISELRDAIDPKLRIAATILVLGYALLLAVGQFLRRQALFAWLIIALAVAEMIYFDRITVANRPVVTKQELNERVGYNDETVDVLRDIKAVDQTFFRFTKTFGSGPSIYPSLNDALVFGYYGTVSYSSFNNLNYIKFLMALGTITPSGKSLDMQWSLGLVGHPLLETFACEKYVFTPDPVPFEKGGPYELVRTYGNISLLRNKFFLPLGLTFTRQISENEFLQLSPLAKQQALLHVAVISSESSGSSEILPRIDLDQLKQEMSESSPPEIIDLRRSTALQTNSFHQSQIEGVVRSEAKSVVVMQTPFDEGWHAVVDGRPVRTLKVDVGLLGVVVESGEHALKLYYRPPFLGVGAAISLFSLMIFVITAWRWPRIQFAA
jgi:Bacterial membrane protein YfhO